MKYIMLFMAILFSQAHSDTSYIGIDFEWQDSIVKVPKKNILDYYLLLPKLFIDCENSEKGLPSMADRIAAIKIRDIANGYIQFFSSAEIALFRNRADTSDIIVVQIGKSGSGSTCGAINNVLQFDTNKRVWFFSDSLIPADKQFNNLYERYVESDIYPYFKLPRHGTEIHILNEDNDSCLSKLIWNGTSFETVIEKDNRR